MSISYVQRRTAVLLILSLFIMGSGRVFAQTNDQKPGTFSPGTDRPFTTLMYDAINNMHRTMEHAVRTGSPDYDFIIMMIPHHQGAIDMARVLLLYGKDREMLHLAQRVISSQQNELVVMQQWQEAHTIARTIKNEKSKPETPFSALLDKAHAAMHRKMEEAERTGDPDHDFAALMIPHHQGAIDMAQAFLQYGKDPELRTLAQQIIVEQQYEIQLMKAWLAAHKL